jgi:hypothetical protein
VLKAVSESESEGWAVKVKILAVSVDTSKVSLTEDVRPVDVAVKV